MSVSQFRLAAVAALLFGCAAVTALSLVWSFSYLDPRDVWTALLAVLCWLVAPLVAAKRLAAGARSRSAQVALAAAIATAAWLVVNLVAPLIGSGSGPAAASEGVLGSVLFAAVFGQPLAVFVIGAAVGWLLSYPRFLRDPAARYW